MQAIENRAKVVIERTYKTSVEELWALWTTKEGFESWWGPEGFRVEVQAIEPRVGGRLDYDMIADTPEAIAAMKAAGQLTSHPTHSHFSDFIPNRRLAITTVIDFIPGVAKYETLAVVELFPAGDRVRLVLTLDALHSPMWTQEATRGWTSQFSKLDRRFGA